MIELNCKQCNKKFTKRNIDKRDKNKFCSSICALNYVRTKKHQVKAGKRGALVNIIKYRGTGAKSYIKENGRHQHRVVMEKHIGRKLKKGEVVHHIDENKKNNDIKNLQLFKTQAAHARHHALLKDNNRKALSIAYIKNTKHGPLCKKKYCKLNNKIGRAYCSHHEYRFQKYGEI